MELDINALKKRGAEILREGALVGKSGRLVYRLTPSGHAEVMERLGTLPVIDIEDWVAEKRGKEVLPERKMLRHVRDSAWGVVTELFGVHLAGPCMCKACEYARGGDGQA